MPRILRLWTNAHSPLHIRNEPRRKVMLMTSAYFHISMANQRSVRSKTKKKSKSPNGPIFPVEIITKEWAQGCSHLAAKCAKVGGILGKPNGPMKGFPFSIKGVLHPERRRLQSIPANVSFSKSKVHFLLLSPIAWTTRFSLFISEEVLVLFS